jgi:diguanylate cyclase (GGDEF)-like protein
VARRLRAAVRADDLVARVGGDEFVVLVPLQEVDSPADVTARIAEALADPVVVGHTATSIDVAASIGVALAAPGDETADVIRRADATMYEAKRTRLPFSPSPAAPPPVQARRR